MADSVRERRRAKRVEISNPRKVNNYILFNLSTQGALFAGLRAMAQGDKASLDVPLPRNYGVLELQGVVKWVQKIGKGENPFYLAGMQFKLEGEANSKILEAYLHFLERTNYIREHRSLAIHSLEKELDLGPGDSADEE
jgi:hypothetical protein